MQSNETKRTLLDDVRFQRMIEEVEDYAIILLDTEGNIRNWNRGAEKIKGYREDEILGRNFSIFYPAQDRKDKLPFRLIAETSANGRADHEGWRLRKDGSTFWAYVVITALHDEQGDIIGFTKVTRDLTERKRAEEQKDRDAKSIALQNKQLEEFAYVTSHDLQEPIRKIRAFIDLARQDMDDRESLEYYLEKIDSSAGRMIQLIKDILAFSRISPNQSQYAQVDLNQVVKDVLAEYEMVISEKNAKIQVDTLPEIQGIYLHLQQLFRNLISNALKFNEDCPIVTISFQDTAKVSSKFPDNGYLINVSDNGIGFDQKYAEQAFQPFKRLTSGFPGSGIGLALCKKIVVDHGGSITVQSKPRKGTTFTLFFPKTK
ncbi:sensor histidine kinase [Algoriphagus halophytocola]|uniref:histidine kinase n=1 Tax=Algoriphagus halophytocola TaxID=2991499 RepID=A0ABY6MFT5_9BACT|nr:PAS domain-containing sensor histidine kinase [Algoriphagus sp. TR-M5]UZD21824.1 PAS domain S-box protein [Algoriphagus sp. TR-M5]